MNIALSTIGSRGDIQLYIALGTELQKKGHNVSILTHPWAKEIINSYGLSHIPVGENIDINYSAKQFVENSENNLKGFSYALNFIFDNLRLCHKDFLSEFKNFDIIIGHGVVGEAEANMLNKPFITVSIAPMGLQKEYWISNNYIKESVTYISDKIMGAFFGKPYIKFRKEVGAPIIKNKFDLPYLALIPIPSFLQKANPNWKEKTVITGYLFAETPNNYTPPDKLSEFIKSGEKPILITFGSMFHNEIKTKQIFKIICDALAISNSRAILIMPDLDESTTKIPDNIFIAKQVPYSWLLEQVELVVHHFGFGTTAEVLKAGLPSIPIPHIFDQKTRAKTIYDLGYSYKPLDIGKIDVNKLSSAIIQVKNDIEMKNKCKNASLEIIKENGLKKASELITEYIDKIRQ
jgi:UDP:flavonoid glycosyltransferase YjiC (YdhE family)